MDISEITEELHKISSRLEMDKCSGVEREIRIANVISILRGLSPHGSLPYSPEVIAKAVEIYRTILIKL